MEQQQRTARPQPLAQLLAGTAQGKPNGSNGSGTTPASRQGSLAATLRRWPTKEALWATFHVSRQTELTADANRCHFTNAPTLALANAAYGRGTAEAWLTAQLADLSEFSGARDKLTPEQLRQTVTLVAGEYHWLNMAEIMLFCRRFKLGQYGKFYGAVDPIAVTGALRDFCRERREACARREARLTAERLERDRHSPLNMSREEYDIIRQITAEYAMNTAEQDRITAAKHQKT